MPPGRGDPGVATQLCHPIGSQRQNERSVAYSLLSMMTARHPLLPQRHMLLLALDLNLRFHQARTGLPSREE